MEIIAGANMLKIKTLNSIAPIGLKQFPADTYTISELLSDPDAILLRSYILQPNEIPASVKVVGRAGAGVNNIPVAHLTELGIPVLNTPGANANAVRELVLAGMLIASRHIYAAIHYVQQLQVTGAALEKEIEQHKKQFVGTELMGKTLAVIGLGSVGVKVANVAIQLGMQVIGYDPTISVNRAWELSSSVQQARSVENVLQAADFVSIHVPLMPNTQHMANQTFFQAMKKNSVLLNFARAEIVDKQALIEALNQDKLAAYVSDFPDAELQNHPRVISLPHLGASTLEAEENCAVMIARQVRDYLEFGVISNSVNFPTMDIPHHLTPVRLAIVNANIPNMVAQISAKLGAAEVNIVSLANKSRDDIAYTVIDIEHPLSTVLLTEIKHIQGVKQVRQLQLT
jgi:D-3-phosphoglycerate dehydrogenase